MFCFLVQNKFSVTTAHVQQDMLFLCLKVQSPFIILILCLLCSSRLSKKQLNHFNHDHSVLACALPVLVDGCAAHNPIYCRGLHVSFTQLHLIQAMSEVLCCGAFSCKNFFTIIFILCSRQFFSSHGHCVLCVVFL